MQSNIVMTIVGCPRPIGTFTDYIPFVYAVYELDLSTALTVGHSSSTRIIDIPAYVKL